MVAQHARKLLEKSCSLFDRRRVRIARTNSGFEEVLKIQHSSVTGEMGDIPTEPADDIDLAFVARPQIRPGLFGEIAHNRAGLPKLRAAVLKRRNFAVGVDRKELWRFV